LGPAGVSEGATLIVLSDPDTIRLQTDVVKRKPQDVVVRFLGTPLGVVVWLLMGSWTGGVRAWTNRRPVWEVPLLLWRGRLLVWIGCG
jgi:hypothetical protein